MDHHEEDQDPVSERFNIAVPEPTLGSSADDVENERFEAASHPIAPRAAASAHDIEDDDSPPPTHFVEIKLPSAAPIEMEHPAQPEESTDYAEATPARAESVQSPDPVQHAEPAPARVPTPAPPPAVTHPAPELPKISRELPPDSNLVLVETVHAPPPMADEPEVPRPRRVRPPRVEVADGPLQLVETAPKESTPPGA